MKILYNNDSNNHTAITIIIMSIIMTMTSISGIIQRIIIITTS